MYWATISRHLKTRAGFKTGYDTEKQFSRVGVDFWRSCSVQKGVIFTCLSYKGVRKGYCQKKKHLDAIIWQFSAYPYHYFQIFSPAVHFYHENYNKIMEKRVVRSRFRINGCHFDAKTSVEKGGISNSSAAHPCQLSILVTPQGDQRLYACNN